MDDHQDNEDNEDDSESKQEQEKNAILASELRKFNLTQENVKVLQKYQNEWKNAKGAIQTGIAMKACQEMLKGDPVQLDKKAQKLKRQVRYNSVPFPERK